jgi:uncharacterized protein YggT (Ycf19 family)
VPPLALLIDSLLRLLVLAAAAGAGLVLLTHWAVRHGHVRPFGALPNAVRRASDPVLRPVERSVVRWGRNPQEAPLWLLGIVVVSGILLLSLSRWVIGFVLTVDSLRGAGPGTWVRFGVDLAFSLLSLALLVRVVGNWLGAGRYNRLMRPFYVVTDWLVEPIRRRLPTFGPFDVSPMVAYIGLLLLRWLLSPVL